CGTPHIEDMLNGCHALVLECNHDIDMLMSSAYPYSLKQRVSSRYGHLSNHESAGILSRLDVGKLQHLIAAHLSHENNTPQLAVQALCNAMDCSQDWVSVATQAGGFEWREVK
ncbi:MAG: MBL fold metallo-hydrolase, partial [Gallionella sp.]